MKHLKRSPNKTEVDMKITMCLVTDRIAEILLRDSPIVDYYTVLTKYYILFTSRDSRPNNVVAVAEHHPDCLIWVSYYSAECAPQDQTDHYPKYMPDQKIHYADPDYFKHVEKLITDL